MAWIVRSGMSRDRRQTGVPTDVMRAHAGAPEIEPLVHEVRA